MIFRRAWDYGGERPPQLVVGTGDDETEIMPPETFVSTEVNGARVITAVSHAGFGYMVWDRVDAQT
jgi:hypothetical protein